MRIDSSSLKTFHINVLAGIGMFGSLLISSSIEITVLARMVGSSSSLASKSLDSSAAHLIFLGTLVSSIMCCKIWLQRSNAYLLIVLPPGKLNKMYNQSYSLNSYIQNCLYFMIKSFSS